MLASSRVTHDARAQEAIHTEEDQGAAGLKLEQSWLSSSGSRPLRLRGGTNDRKGTMTMTGWFLRFHVEPCRTLTGERATAETCGGKHVFFGLHRGRLLSVQGGDNSSVHLGVTIDAQATTRSAYSTLLRHQAGSTDTRGIARRWRKSPLVQHTLRSSVASARRECPLIERRAAPCSLLLFRSILLRRRFFYGRRGRRLLRWSGRAAR